VRIKRDERNRATWRIREAAKVMGTGEKALRDAIKAGVIPHLRFGRSIVIPKSALAKFLESAGEKTA
jgi:excisionase family DNA binding protein